MSSKISAVCIIALTLFVFNKSYGESTTYVCPNSAPCTHDPKMICCPPGIITVIYPDVTTPFNIKAQPSISDDENYENDEKYYWYSGWSLYLVGGVFLVVIALCVWFIYHCLMRYMIACYCECCQLRHPRTPSEHDSAGSCCPPPRYSRCSSLYRMPPAYSEVASKPDMYPLVITCGNNDKGYLMVQYFRSNPNTINNNRDCPPSAASTTDSVNSSYLCNTANEANKNVPPPYSYASPDDRRPEGAWPLPPKSAVITPPRRRLPPTPYHRTHSDTSYDRELHYVDDEEMIAIDPIMRTVVLSEGFLSSAYQPSDLRPMPTEYETDSESDPSIGGNALSPTFFKRAKFFYKNETRRGLVGYVSHMGYKLRVTSAPTTPDDVYGANRPQFRARRGNSSTPRLNSRNKGENEPLFDQHHSDNF